MKIRTIEELEDKLEHDMGWRKKEILSLKLLIESNELNRRILLRAGIALLCAHFEGFIKNASNFYVVYVTNKKLKCNEIVHSLLAIKLKNDFKSCGESEKHSVHGLMLDKIDLTKNDNFYVKYTEDNPIISTESNPTSGVLEEILKTLGVRSDIFHTKKHYIDRSLLCNRHKVVHGERFELEYKDFNTVFDVIMDLLENYKELIIQSAEKEVFLKDK